MAKKPVASASEVISGFERVEEAIERAAGRIEGIAKTVSRIEEAIAKLAKTDFVPHIIPDKRYRISELKVFGFTPGFLYKRYKHLIQNDGTSYILGRNVSKMNESAPTLALAPASVAVAVPRRRGRPRKDAKRSTDESADDGITKNRVVIIKNRVVYVGHWDRCARRAA